MTRVSDTRQSKETVLDHRQQQRRQLIFPPNSKVLLGTDTTVGRWLLVALPLPISGRERGRAARASINLAFFTAAAPEGKERKDRKREGGGDMIERSHAIANVSFQSFLLPPLPSPDLSQADSQKRPLLGGCLSVRVSVTEPAFSPERF